MKFSNTYIHLGERFFDLSQPTPVAAPNIFLWNKRLAEQLNIPAELQQDAETQAQVFSGNQRLPGSEPLAAAYAGHQFGNFNPQLGDGRAHLLGELLDKHAQRWDLQLKGSGTSAFSRGGDGRCALGPAIREYIMSEAMYALGVPTTQCLAVTTTGEEVYRQHATPGAVVTRVASSHIRVGNFQFFAARGDTQSLEALANYTIERHFPGIDETKATKTSSQRYIDLLDRAIEKQITLIVGWLRVGFIHGVMNTDNTSINGETIDFGPCAMLGAYNPRTVFSSIDHQGRYAFGNQANIAHWNMTRFAECLLQLLDKDSGDGDEAQIDVQQLAQIQTLIDGFPERFQSVYLQMMSEKLGLPNTSNINEHKTLIDDLLQRLTERKLDYTITFDRLTKSLTCAQTQTQLKEELGEVFESWLTQVMQQNDTIKNTQTLMRRQNPCVIPRNHQLERVLKECEQTGLNLAALTLLGVLRKPYEESDKTRNFQAADDNYDSDYQTFCGT